MDFETLASDSAKPRRKRVCILGGGHWGTVIGKIVSQNVMKMPDFDDTVRMYVSDEYFLGQALHVFINKQHENIKSLPGIKLPKNLVAFHGILNAVKDADVLIFVVPRTFISALCMILKGIVKQDAVGLSMIKCVLEADDGGIDLISNFISRKLDIPCWVMMGPAMPREIAEEKFCEAVIGCKDSKTGKMFCDLLQTDYLRVQVTNDSEAVELCGALKHILSFAWGFCSALRYGESTKSIILRKGLQEIMKFVKTFYPDTNTLTFLMPCGISDLHSSMYGKSRNYRVAEGFLQTKKSISELEDTMLEGHSVEGHFVAEHVYNTLMKAKKVTEFPLFTSVHLICSGEIMPTELMDHCFHMTPFVDSLRSGPSTAKRHSF